MRAAVLLLPLLVPLLTVRGQQMQIVVDDYYDDQKPYEGKRFDQFDWELCREVSRAESGNLVMSPISVKLLLAMLSEGASGATAKELERVLNFSPHKSDNRIYNSAVLRSLQARNKEYLMEIGTKMYIHHKLNPKNWFQRVLYLYYNAYVEKINFTDYNAAAARINNWVDTATHGMIHDLISQADSLANNKLLLVNAIYFKGTWKHPFEREDTFSGKFESPGGPKDVQYMVQSGHFYYLRSNDLKSQLLRLPYLGNKYAMYVVLPDQGVSLDQLVETIDPSRLRRQIWDMEEVSVDVFLPRFKFDFTADLKMVLRKLGLKRIFDSYGEMKGIARTRKSTTNLVVSDVIQKAAIEVTEIGTVAAAATEIQLVNKFGGLEELFNASRPFLFFIEDETSGTIVFAGKVCDP